MSNIYEKINSNVILITLLEETFNKMFIFLYKILLNSFEAIASLSSRLVSTPWEVIAHIHYLQDYTGNTARGLRVSDHHYLSLLKNNYI